MKNTHVRNNLLSAKRAYLGAGLPRAEPLSEHVMPLVIQNTGSAIAHRQPARKQHAPSVHHQRNDLSPLSKDRRDGSPSSKQQLKGKQFKLHGLHDSAGSSAGRSATPPNGTGKGRGSAGSLGSAHSTVDGRQIESLLRQMEDYKLEYENQ